MTHDITARQQVIDLAAKGTRPGEIAARTDLSINTIYYDLTSARKMGLDIPKFNRGPPRSVSKARRITLSVPKALGSQAILRGLTIGLLAELLLARIATDNLADAVLDDGGSSEQ
jgi:transposase